jgi:DNA-binding CsgD family transcriptional regulator
MGKGSSFVRAADQAFSATGSAMTASDLERVAKAIYATVRAPALWPSVLADICAYAGADGGLIFRPPMGETAALPLFAHRLDLTPVLDSYPRNSSRAELTTRALAKSRDAHAFLYEELIPPAEQSANEYWRKMIEPLGVKSGIFALIRPPDDGPHTIALSLFRIDNATPFTRHDIAALEPLLADLRRALALQLDASLSDELPAGMKDLFEAIGTPCLLIGADGKVSRTNPAAEALLASGLVSVQDGQFTVTDKAAQKRIDAAIAAMIENPFSRTFRGGSEILVRRPAASALVVTITAIGADNPIASVAAPARCAIFVLEEALRTNRALPSRLARLYGLTAAETEIAIDLACGRSLEEISWARGTAVTTVRTQIKILLAKTNTRRQAELSALVNRLSY